MREEFFAPFLLQLWTQKKNNNIFLQSCRDKYLCFVEFFPFSRGDDPWENAGLLWLKKSPVATGFNAAYLSAQIWRKADEESIRTKES